MKPAKRKKTAKGFEEATKPAIVGGARAKTYPHFKKPQYRENGFTHQVKVWKNLKNMAAMEKSSCEPGTPTHASLSAPPSTKPIKNYSDISGLPAPYKDPRTKLRYANKEEYQAISHLPPDVILGLLALRKG